jgi:hypothetical protein
LCANAGPEAEDAAAWARGPATAERGLETAADEEEVGKGARGFGEEVELRRSWCGPGDEDGGRERVEKAGEESDGEMRRRPWWGPEPEGSMAD